MINYPNTLPTDAVMLVVDKLRGKEVAWDQVGLAGWNLLGYALSQIPNETVLPILSEPVSEDRNAAADYLEEHLGSAETIQSGAIIWLVVAKIVLRFILNVV